MPWSDPDPVGERGFETTYSGRGFRARLIFDCHREPRKLEVSLAPRGDRDVPDPRGAPQWDALIEHLKPFGAPRVISPGQLVLFDRPGYFRLNLIPGRLQALLRKEAPLSVVAELITQLSRACGEDTVPALSAQDCPVGAIMLAGERETRDKDPGVTPRENAATAVHLHIDSARCTHCLDCVRPYAAGTLLPSGEGPDGDAPRAGQG